ncbi:MAG TPA: hypothetical protein VFW33_19410, partial [Gemmataceae bacterium]|nr:hypothetical protein [Gemmataceae bacterium]
IVGVAQRILIPEGGGRVAKKEGDAPEVLGFLGVGLDNADGHKRVTQSESFLLVGGSEETHERMQDTAIHFEEELRKRGKRLQDTSADEAADLLRDAMDS